MGTAERKHTSVVFVRFLWDTARRPPPGPDESGGGFTPSPGILKRWKACRFVAHKSRPETVNDPHDPFPRHTYFP